MKSSKIVRIITLSGFIVLMTGFVVYRINESQAVSQKKNIASTVSSKLVSENIVDTPPPKTSTIMSSSKSIIVLPPPPITNTKSKEKNHKHKNEPDSVLKKLQIDTAQLKNKKTNP